MANGVGLEKKGRGNTRNKPWKIRIKEKRVKVEEEKK